MSATEPHRTPKRPAPRRYACPACRATFRQDFPRCPLDGAALEPVTREPLVGHTLADRYQIEECIGHGGMGQVYRARHTRMSRLFAIKVLYGDLVADSTMRARFSREAEVASLLAHPNLVSVVDFGETPEGLLYLAMEYVDGPLLSQVIRHEGPLGLDRTTNLLRQLASGLEHAHGEGLVHRDFKPDNIIVTRLRDGEVAKILDFGIARIMAEGDTHQLTAQGALMGTPAFMAPEQIAGEDVDHRADLFSLGVTVYQMACGKLPFDGDPTAIMRQTLALDPPPIEERAPGVDVDPRIAGIVRKLMTRAREARYQSAQALIHEIDQWWQWWVPPGTRAAATPAGGAVAAARGPGPVTPVHVHTVEHGPTWDLPGTAWDLPGTDVAALADVPTVATSGAGHDRNRAPGDGARRTRPGSVRALVAVVLVAAGIAAILLRAADDGPRPPAPDPGAAPVTTPMRAVEASGPDDDAEPVDPARSPEPAQSAESESLARSVESENLASPPDPVAPGELVAVVEGTADSATSDDGAAVEEPRRPRRDRKPADRGAHPEPARVTPAAFKKRYTDVVRQLEEFRREFPDNETGTSLARTLSRVDYWDVNDPTRRARSYRQLGTIARRLARARRAGSRR